MEGRTPATRESWDEQGFAVLPGAAPQAAIERLGRELDDAADRLLVRAPGDEYPSLAARRAEGRAGAGAVDPYVLSRAARELLLAPAVTTWLRDVLAEAPLLLGAKGSAAGAPSDGPFRDPTFVRHPEPEGLVGAVVALGDATLPVFPGSHRLPVALFSGRYRHVNPERDGEQALAEHQAQLAHDLDAAGLAEEALALHAGDVVLWQAELAHRGAEGLALVAHLAPASSEPWWFAHRPDRAYRVPHGDGCFTSRHYALADLPGAVAHEVPASPPPGPERGRPEVQAVERQLERHDAELAQEPPTQPPRPRGLVGRVRGAMGRRPPRP